MLLRMDGEEVAELCVERLKEVWHVDYPEIDVWEAYYYDMFCEVYGENDVCENSIMYIVDNDYVNYLDCIILEHDIHHEEELALQELEDLGYSFSDVEELEDRIVFEQDGQHFIIGG